MHSLPARVATTAVLAIWLGTSIAFAARPTALSQFGQLVGLFSLMCLFVWSLVSTSRHMRDRPLVRLLPALLASGALLVGPFIGMEFREHSFSGNLPRYQSLLKVVLAHNPGPELMVIQVPAEFSDLAYGIHARSTDTCGLLVDFFWGSGFPVKHTVRRYSESDTFLQEPECRRDWHVKRELAPHWHELSD